MSTCASDFEGHCHVTCIWDVEGKERATRCSCQFDLMLKAHMRFVCVWPSKEQLTLWNHPTTTEMIDSSLLNLCKEQSATISF